MLSNVPIGSKKELQYFFYESRDLLAPMNATFSYVPCSNILCELSTTFEVVNLGCGAQMDAWESCPGGWGIGGTHLGSIAGPHVGTTW